MCVISSDSDGAQYDVVSPTIFSLVMTLYKDKSQG